MEMMKQSKNVKHYPYLLSVNEYYICLTHHNLEFRGKVRQMIKRLHGFFFKKKSKRYLQNYI